MSVELAATVAVRDLDVELTVTDGETLAILGPNGSGKSTILSIVAGLLHPDTGRVVLDGRRLTIRESGVSGVRVPPHDRQVALLAQDALLFPHLTVLENVAFAPRSRGVRRAAARLTARHWLDEVGIADLADRRPAQISGGQAQRAALARALAADPRLLLLDEPMAALDVAVAPALRQTLRRVLSDRTAMLITHDPLDALLLADSVIVLDEGRIVERGQVTEVLARPRSPFAAQIAGLNMLRGSWRDDRVRTDDGTEIHGLVVGPPPGNGDQVVAAFPPAAAALYLQPPGGSPRNAIRTVVSAIEPQGGFLRVRAGSLSADITPQALAELDLAPGSPVTFSVKATEVSVYLA